VTPEDKLKSPQFLERLGRVALRFAFLESILGATLQSMSDMPFDLAQPLFWRASYTDKIDRFVLFTKHHLRRLPTLRAQYDDATIDKLRLDLEAAGSKRNTLMHGYWTYSEDLKALRIRRFGTRGKSQSVPKSEYYPTDENMDELAEQLGTLRQRVTEILNVFMRAERDARTEG
jgi:hypothetical protein